MRKGFSNFLYEKFRSEIFFLNFSVKNNSKLKKIFHHLSTNPPSPLDTRLLKTFFLCKISTIWFQSSTYMINLKLLLFFKPVITLSYIFNLLKPIFIFSIKCKAKTIQNNMDSSVSRSRERGLIFHKKTLANNSSFIYSFTIMIH